MTKIRHHATKRGHTRHDKNILSVADLLNSIDDYTYRVVSKEQSIVNEAITMRKPTNNKELKQVYTVLRQVTTMNNNLDFIKEATYTIPTAPRGFLERINGLIDTCNEYIEKSPMLQLDDTIKPMRRVTGVDMKGILFYDDKKSRTVTTSPAKATTTSIPSAKEAKVSLEDIL